MKIGQAIKLCRVRKNMKQSQLAEDAKISVSYLSLLERGKRDPNFSTIKKIADALKIPVSIIVFLAAEDEELDAISKELAEKLSYTALKLIDASNYDSARV